MHRFRVGVAEQMAEDRRRIAFWTAAARGTSMIPRWQSVEHRERAKLARTRVKQPGQINSSSQSANRPTACPQVVATR
jgi:hypothetical protein